MGLEPGTPAWDVNAPCSDLTIVPNAYSSFYKYSLTHPLILHVVIHVLIPQCLLSIVQSPALDSDATTGNSEGLSNSNLRESIIKIR